MSRAPSIRNGVALAAVLALTTTTLDANALVIARTTRHGYIVVDEPGATFEYGDTLEFRNAEGTFFLQDITELIANHPGAPRAEYIGVMQVAQTRDLVASYFAVRSTTRGVGLRDPLMRGGETWDHNGLLMTAYPVTGYVFLNTLDFFLTEALRGFGRYIVCTQEFGHRTGANARITAVPGGGGGDGGVDAGIDARVDASVEAGMEASVDAGADDAADAAADDASGAGADVSADTSTPTPLPPDILLGRDRSHWSYFLDTGGSPMEGNRWEETSPGVFHTRMVSFRFSPLDLYLMGLAPASSVPPFFLIAEPDVGGMRDIGGGPITRGSSPEYYGRDVVVRGRRVTYTIDDVIRANGVREPAYVPREMGGPDPNLHVAWVLLAPRDRVNDELAANFDRAVEWCAGGYEESTGGRARLVDALPPPGPGLDAGSDSATDASRPADTDTDASPSDTVATADTNDDVPFDGRRPNQVTGGCQGCRVALESRATSRRRAVTAATWFTTLLASCLHRARRDRRRRRRADT